jgi:hypothetical protein
MKIYLDGVIPRAFINLVKRPGYGGVTTGIGSIIGAGAGGISGRTVEAGVNIDSLMVISGIAIGAGLGVG